MPIGHWWKDHDWTITTATTGNRAGWQYYLPPNSSLIDAGSTTADPSGFVPHTTQVSQVAEGFSTVDIGYHYVATDASGNPLDSNSDGIPDYIEDANGNGLIDNGGISVDGTAACNHGANRQSVSDSGQQCNI